jgi:hypothetical protein
VCPLTRLNCLSPRYLTWAYLSPLLIRLSS